MTVAFEPDAEQDLRDIRYYVLKKFGVPAWADTVARVRTTADSLKTFSLSGAVPEEPADLGRERYRQLVLDELVIVESLEQSEVKTGAELAAYVGALECAQDRGLKKVRLNECSCASESIVLIDRLVAEASLRKSRQCRWLRSRGPAQTWLTATWFR